HWRKGLLINAVGAGLSAVVFLIASVTKFSQGAWVALLLIALLATIAWRIRRNYDLVHHALALHPLDPETPRPAILPQRPSPLPRGDELQYGQAEVEGE